MPPLNPSALLATLLDTGYSQATAGVIAAIAQETERGPLAERLKQLEQRAEELDQADELLPAEDATLRALLADLGDSLEKGAILIAAVSPLLEGLGINAAGQYVRQISLPGVSDQQLAGIGVRWNNPDPEALNAVVNYTNSDAWAALLKKYGDIEAQVRAIALDGIAGGRGALAIARDLREAIESLPASQANTLMRTLQMQSFKEATALNQVANADILEPETIRIAALDDRTCMSCVALHGTRLPLGATVDDHWNGRCTSITIVKGLPPPDVQTGEDWFANRTEDQQREQMGNAAYEAWKAGAISLQDFPERHTDALFGEMITKASLKGMLGRAAKDYYMTN